MSTVERDLQSVNMTDPELWTDGPPHEVFRELREKCPVHWTPELTDFPDEDGFWSVTTADDILAVTRDFRTYSSELGGVTAVTHAIPLELARAMFIAMDPPKHDRVKALFQRGFTPKRIAAHEDEIRAIVVRVLDRLEGRETCDLVRDVAQPAVTRVIDSFMGVPEEEDPTWARLANAVLGATDEDMNADGLPGVLEKDVPEVFERCRTMIAERREHPTDDLTSVLVHAEVDGQKLEENEIVMGFFLLVAAGSDSTKATYCSGMRALMEHPDQMRLVLDDPSLIPSAVEESLRMFPAFSHFRRTATCDTELHGQKIRAGEKVVMSSGSRSWMPAASSSNASSSISRTCGWALAPARASAYRAPGCSRSDRPRRRHREPRPAPSAPCGPTRARAAVCAARAHRASPAPRRAPRAARERHSGAAP